MLLHEHGRAALQRFPTLSFLRDFRRRAAVAEGVVGAGCQTAGRLKFARSQMEERLQIPAVSDRVRLSAGVLTPVKKASAEVFDSSDFEDALPDRD